MHICMITRSMPAHGKGGMEDHTLMLCKELAKLNNEVVVITTSLEDKEYENIEGVEIYYLKNTEKWRYSKSWWKESVRAFKELDKKYKFDVIHSQSAGAYSILKDKTIMTPVVTTFHGTSIDEIKTAINTDMNLNPISFVRSILKILYHIKFYFTIGLFLAKKSKSIIAISNEQENILIKFYRISKDKIFKVYTGIDVSIFKPEQNKKENIIMCAGRLVKEKGVQNTIRAMKIVIEKHPEYKLIVVGDGDYKKQLEKEAFNIRNNVEFIGQVDHEKISDYINKCHIFVNSTIRQNGYDLTIIESMACEKPVIVTNIGSVPTVITDKINGMLVKKGDIREIANAINTLIGNEEFAIKIAKNARKTIIEKFSLESMVENTINVYRHAL